MTILMYACVAATERSHMMSVITNREDLVYVEYPVLYQVGIFCLAECFTCGSLTFVCCWLLLV